MTTNKGEDTAANANLVYSTRMSRSSPQPAHQTTHGQTCCQVISIKDFDTTPAAVLVPLQALRLLQCSAIYTTGSAAWSLNLIVSSFCNVPAK